MTNYLKKIKLYFFLVILTSTCLDYDIHPPTNEFLDSLSSHHFLPHILQPSRVTTNSKTLDNIFSNMAVSNIISGSLTASISNHLPQFLVAQFLVPDYFSVEWDNFLLSPNRNTEKSYKTFLEKFESLPDTYAPLKNFF